jgi:translation initiation factor 4G
MQNNQSSGVTIVNGAPAAQGDHSRKPSVTISSAGTTGYIPNGGPAGGVPSRTNNIQFGALNQGSPAMGGPAMLAGQPQLGLGVAQPGNPRITSPSTSPSPIPQPASSGGRPPSTYQTQGNAPNFGSFGDSGDFVSHRDCSYTTVLLTVPHCGIVLEAES